MSDQGGCPANQVLRASRAVVVSASSATTAQPAPSVRSRVRACGSGAIAVSTCWAERLLARRLASRPTGASMTARISNALRRNISSIFVGVEQLTRLAPKTRDARQHTLELFQDFSNLRAGRPDLHFTKSSLVVSTSLLDNGNRLPYLAGGLKETQQDYSVGEKTHIDGTLHSRSHHSVLSE